MKTPLVLSKKFCKICAIVGGATLGGLIYGIGQNCGEYAGMMETNEFWKNAVDKAIADAEKDRPDQKNE